MKSSILEWWLAYSVLLSTEDQSGYRQTLEERVQLSLHTYQKYLKQVLPVLSPGTPWDSPTVSTFGLRSKDSKAPLSREAGGWDPGGGGVGSWDPGGTGYQMRQKEGAPRS